MCMNESILMQAMVHLHSWMHACIYFSTSNALACFCLYIGKFFFGTAKVFSPCSV